MRELTTFKSDLVVADDKLFFKHQPILVQMSYPAVSDGVLYPRFRNQMVLRPLLIRGIRC